MAKFFTKKFSPLLIAIVLMCGFFIFGVNKSSATMDFATLFNGLHDSLVSQGINNNIETCGTTPTACAGLYFEKVGKGKISFSGSLDMTDSATISLLQSLDTKLEITNGHIKLDASTAAALKNASSTIEMSGLNNVTQPNLIVKDDAGNIITDTSFIDNISYAACAVSPGVSGQCFTFNTAHFTSFDLSTIQITNVAELRDAIKNQADGQTWIISAGNYGLDRFNDITVEGQTGWYFPITAKNLTIEGSGNPVIYGNEYSANGNWSSQNLVSVFGDNVTLKGLTFEPKVEGNKTIEVLGNDFSAENIIIKPNTLVDNSVYENMLNLDDRAFSKEWGGSIYFSHEGNHSLKNVTVNNGGISFRYSSAGTHIVFDNVKVINKTAIGDINGYRFSSGFNATDTSITGSPIVIYEVSTTTNNLDSALKGAKDGDTVKIFPGDYNITKDDVTVVSGQTGWYLPITKNNITLVGVDADGQEITNAADVKANLYSTQETANGAWASQNLITVFGNNVTFKGLGIMNKISPNKGIEVVGDNFRAENCLFAPISVSLLSSVADYTDPDGSLHNDISKYGSGVYFNNNGATEARTGTVVNNIFKNSGVTFDSFIDNWSVNVESNTFDGNRIWSWTDAGGYQSQYYSSIGATTWANQPDFTGSEIKINKNKFINTVDGQVIVKIKSGMTGQFDAKNNWWGTTNEATIKAKTLGDVLFNPWYTTELMTSLAQPLEATTTVSTTTTEVVVSSDNETASEINIPSDVTNATINVGSLLTTGDTSDTATLPAAITIKSDTSLGEVEVAMPADLEISAASGDDWNGIINAPQVKLNSSVTPTADSGKEATVSAVVEVGFGDTKLTFNKAVRIIIAGQAGKEAGYSRAGVFTKINTTCTADTQTAGDALAAEGDCKMDVGSDLVIWTKHFTSFVSYSQSNIPSGGGGGGYTPTPSACASVEYSDWGVCTNGLQYRNFKSQTPSSCQVTPAQIEAGKQTCGQVLSVKVTETSDNGIGLYKPGNKGGQVLGVKEYANGALLRFNKKIYVVSGGRLLKISNLKELAKYQGKKIIDVDEATIKGYSFISVLGIKAYANGVLIKSSTGKIFLIINGGKYQIKNLKELAKYKGKKIIKVTDVILAQYPNVLKLK